MSLFLVEEGLAVGDEVLQVAQLRPVHGWIIDFRDDAIPKRKPDLAGSRVCGSDSVFSAMGPTGMNPGMSKRRVLSVRLRHFDSPLDRHGRLMDYRSERDATETQHKE